MADDPLDADPVGHSHVFLGEEHAKAEHRTWIVISLCGAMMALEIVGGVLFGSLALVADGLHMSTHAGALLLAALAYSYARRHAGDRRFTFGTGKLGDLAGFTSAIVLAMIALLIGYEALTRLFAPVPIRFGEAIPIAVLGLGVNVASAWLLAGGHEHAHGHAHGHGHSHQGHSHAHGLGHANGHSVATSAGMLVLSLFEEGHRPIFRLRAEAGSAPLADTVTIETVRPDGAGQVFAMQGRGDYLQSTQSVPEPHAFTAVVRLGAESYPVVFDGRVHEAGAEQGSAHRDNNMRAAIVHVMADAAVSVLVIVGLLLARGFGWLWMDPLAGLVGAVVIASWSLSLIKDTGAILLDMCPDPKVEREIRRTIELGGDRVNDLHLWRLGPGHLGVILSVTTQQARDPGFYRQQLARFHALSHVTVEVLRAG